MPLVAYADSSSDDDSPTNVSSHGTSTSPPRKRPCPDSASRLKSPDNGTALPPLPPSFRNLYATSTRVSTEDDPALHAGRKRQTPHIEGNWPTHIFIEWYPTATEASALTALIASVSASFPHPAPHIHTSFTSDLGVPLPLHISLSAPLLLRTEQRAAFLDAARRAIRRACPRGCFRVVLRGLDWASNAEGNRWFLAQRVAKPDGNELNRLLGRCNVVAAEFGLPQLYDSRDGDGVGEIGTADRDEGDTKVKDWSSRFHFSVGWTLTPPVDDGQDRKIRQAYADSEKLRAVEGITVSVGAVKVKIGNTVTAVELDNKNA